MFREVSKEVEFYMVEECVTRVVHIKSRPTIPVGVPVEVSWGDAVGGRLSDGRITDYL